MKKHLPTEFAVKDAHFTVTALTETTQTVMAQKDGHATEKMTLKVGVTKPKVYRLFFGN
jgi:hypothetical protein